VVGERGDGVPANGEGEIRYTLYHLPGDSSSPARPRWSDGTLSLLVLRCLQTATDWPC
jgi:hypothetical protein